MSATSILLSSLLKKQAVRLAKRTVTADVVDVGRWVGNCHLYPDGAVIERIGGFKVAETRIYQFVNDLDSPLRFIEEDRHIEFMPGVPGVAFRTDLGSIPWYARSTPREYLRLRPEDFPEAYIGHDFTYAAGYIWVRRPGKKWGKLEVDRRQADVLLYWFLSAKSPMTNQEPNRLEAQTIYRAVRMGGFGPWNRYHGKDRDKPVVM